jgi:hypothetical protein
MVSYGYGRGDGVCAYLMAHRLTQTTLSTVYCISKSYVEVCDVDFWMTFGFCFACIYIFHCVDGFSLVAQVTFYDFLICIMIATVSRYISSIGDNQVLKRLP